MKRHIASMLIPAIAIVCDAAFAQNVKVTSLGSHNGELCNRDRAT